MVCGKLQGPSHKFPSCSWILAPDSCVCRLLPTSNNLFFPLTIPSKEVFLQSVQQSIETLLKIYDVSSTADKGESRGVIEYNAPFLGKRAGVFLWEMKCENGGVF